MSTKAPAPTPVRAALLGGHASAPALPPPTIAPPPLVEGATRDKFLAQVWADGEPDPQWTQELQTQLADAAQAASVRPESLVVNCATQLCRVDIAMTDHSDAERLAGFTGGRVGNFTLTNLQMDEGAFHATAYVARVGDSLPDPASAATSGE
ncbi:MAG TPA: hypothetical protein VF331_21735 [Polyangiales bacterium]